MILVADAASGLLSSSTVPIICAVVAGAVAVVVAVIQTRHPRDKAWEELLRQLRSSSAREAELEAENAALKQKLAVARARQKGESHDRPGD